MSDDLNPRIADRLIRAARAAQALSETLWEALHEELADPRAPRVVELSERLSEVSATVALLAGAELGRGAESAAESDTARVREPPRTPESPISPRESIQSSGLPEEPEPASRAGLIDESLPRTDEPPEPASRTGSIDESLPRTDNPPPLSDEPTAVLIDELAPTPRTVMPAPEESEILIRDERSEPHREHAPGERAPGEQARGEQAGEGNVTALITEEGRPDGQPEGRQAPWIASIERRLERYERDHAQFAVLLIELADVERLRHAELPGEVARLTGQVETVLASELRPADSLTRESPGRYWLLAPETNADNARTLAERLTKAVGDGISHRGVPLRVAVGIAVCPADGLVVRALVAHANIGLYAARSTGRPFA